MTQSISQEISNRINEAEAYNKHGLFEEAVRIFEEILLIEELDRETSDFIADRIREILKDIDEIEKIDEQILSKQQATHLADTWKGKGSVPEILDSAEAFEDLGLHKEAAEEYGKLLAMTDVPFSEYSQRFLDLLFSRFTPTKISEQLDGIFTDYKISNERMTEVLFSFAENFEKRNNKDLALEYFEKIKKIDPDFAGLKDKLVKHKKKKVYKSKYDYLLEKELVTSQQLREARDLSKQESKSTEFILITKMKIDKDDLGKSLSLFYNCPFKAFDKNMTPPVGLIKNLKKNFLLQNMWVPVEWDFENGIDVVIDDPQNLMKTDQISNLLEAKKINYMVSVPEDIKAYIQAFYEAPQDDSADTEAMDIDNFNMAGSFELEEEEDDDDDVETLGGTESEVVRMVDQIIFSAYKKNASDIHIEPSAGLKKTKIRYRVDGVCQQVLQVPNTFAAGLLSRLKVMSGLDIAERRLPQDGKIKFKRKGIKEFELRLATLPTAGGFEDAVLRILASSGAMHLDDMGMNKRNLNLIKDTVVQPYGLFLVVGPTGSGKTTTLHSALAYINRPGVKIWTAEDPVEITQEGLRQVECKPKIGLDFARVMRAFLRADPDVIMIGEMRDHETAATGIEASLTGHMVFSTLHTNSAPETITRLLDMGLNPLNFSDAFLGVLAQRLVRRLCKKCKEEFIPDDEKVEEIVFLYGGKDIFESTSGFSVDELKSMKMYKACGCDECSGGYRGRLGIHELMAGTAEIKKLIKKKAPTENIFKTAAAEGMKTLTQDGLDKVFQGITDVDEIRRVCVN